MGLARSLVVAAVLWLAWVPAPAGAETLRGHCVSVHDGDTLTVMAGTRKEKIRLLGIDAPEIGQPPWGYASRDYVRGLALDKNVRVETDVQERDKYGRLLGYVYVGSTFVNLEAVKAGHAVLLTYAPNVRHVDLFTSAQTAARTKGLGLWNPKAPLAQTPYQFRHQNDGKPRFDRGDTYRVASPVPSAGGSAGPIVTGQAVRFNKRSKKFHRPGCSHTCKTCIEVPEAEALSRGGVACKGGR